MKLAIDNFLIDLCDTNSERPVVVADDDRLAAMAPTAGFRDFGDTCIHCEIQRLKSGAAKEPATNDCLCALNCNHCMFAIKTP